MTILVDKAYIEAGLKIANEQEESLRKRFRQAYGKEQGDHRVNGMIAKMRANIRSDSKEPSSQS